MLSVKTLTFWSNVVLLFCSVPVVLSSVTSIYSSVLTNNHPKYDRKGGTNKAYYYEDIQVTVSMNGTFQFIGDGTEDMYGYIYENSFNSSNCSSNLLKEDDDHGGNFKFLLKVFLQHDIIYILVVTTYTPGKFGAFSISGSGPGDTINFNRTTVLPTTTPTTNTSAICYQPTIKLFPETKPEYGLAQFRKFQSFYISSYIKVDCNRSAAIVTEWTIYMCNPNCSLPVQLNQSVITKSNQLYIPARTLDYGIYELRLAVKMRDLPELNSSESAYVRITQSNITANLVPHGTSIITSSHQKNLTLNPGEHSVDTEGSIFNSSDWIYIYYCRLYDLYDSNNNAEAQTIDTQNHSCFSNSTKDITVFPYIVFNSINSSVTILAGSLASNQAYQFRVLMTNRLNASFQAEGYVIVKIQDAESHLIAVACVISTMCSPDFEYQVVNPTTQVALFSICIDTCMTLKNITWYIYNGPMNSSTKTGNWTRFNRMNFPSDDRFFGMNTSNFTATSKLFMDNLDVTYWRFEALYSFVSGNSSSAINFRINHPPEYGNCSISPLNGTTSTRFISICSDWSDSDGILDYSFYAWTTDVSRRIMLATTAAPHSELRLPPGNGKALLVNIIVEIRDTLNSIKQYNLTPVVVTPDTKEIDMLVNSFKSTSSTVNQTNLLIESLTSSDQNTVGQALTIVSQVINDMNGQAVENAVSNGVPAASISISPLGSSVRHLSAIPLNISALADYNEQLNMHANALEYSLAISTNFSIINADSIKIQASTLSKVTEATNQLTRNTTVFASARCHELSRALLSWAPKIAREDVELAATYIAQCAANVLSAVNAPLQERGRILDLDFNRANAFPDDYDTDLESVWANQNLFADGDDFSSETIQKGRNNYYQKQTANIIATQVAEIYSSITAALKIHLNVGQNTIINTASVFVSTEPVSRESLSNKIIKQVGGAQIRIPSNFNLSINDNETFFIRSVMQPLASSDNSRSSTNTNLSTSISLSLVDTYGTDILINASIDEPIEFIIPRDPNAIVSSINWQYVSSENRTNRSFNLHSINILRNNKLDVSVHFEIRPVSKNLAYWFIYKFDHAPQVNCSINLIDGWALFCPRNLTNNDFYRYFIDNRNTSNHHSIVFGLRELNETEILYFCSYISMNNSLPIISDEPFNFSSDYEVRTYTSGCYYLDSNNNWQSNGLRVGPLTNLNQTQCFSTHLTTFAGGFLALPVEINFNYAFANGDFKKNKTIYITIICVCTCYLILVIFARHRDKKDIDKLGVTFLPDNRKVDRYFYQIIVFTGHRKDSGTESKVHFVLGGDNDETKVRTLADPHRKILQRGGINAFIMAVPKSLGPLNYLRIWHDNTGKDAAASWFLKYIIVRDLQTKFKTHFICQRWFAVEKDDGVIDRLLPVAGEYQKQQLAYVLSKQAYHSMSEGHLWFSIFSRPPSSKFTRVQRCTCCFVLLFTAMLFNILYYEQLEASKASANKAGLLLGPFYFSREQLGIGVIVELLSFFPSLLLVQFFRRIRQRHSSRSKISPMCETMTKTKIVNDSENKQKEFKITFPWWCIYLAYILSFLLVGISILLIIVCSIEFGDLETQKWLTSVVIGFFSSVCFTQPIKVLCLAIFFAIFIRNLNDDDEMTEHIEDINHFDLIEDKEHPHPIQDKSLFINHSHTRANRLNEAEVEEARNRRVKEIHMWSIIREILSCLGFLGIVYALTYSNLNSNAFLQVNHLRHFFLNIGHSQYDYTKIVSINEYWNWLEKSFVENIRAQRLYKDENPYHLKGFINDTSNRLIGWAIIRQLRVKSESSQTPSSVEHLNMTCESDYSLLNEEKQSFQPGWVHQRTINYSSSIHNAFLYKSSQKLDTYVYTGNHETYGSGGYVYEFRGRQDDLRSNLSQLHQLGWIDKKTRAVIIQVSLYNPNVQMFTLVTLLAELLTTGGIIPTARFEPLIFHNYTSLFHWIIAVIYMVFILYFMIVEIQSLRQLKCGYFRQFWCYIQWGIIGCSWAGLGIYIWRYREMSRIANLFRQTKGYSYINLQLATYVNDILTVLLGFCCFCSAMKLLRFGRFNRHLSLFNDTLRHATKNLIFFKMTFSIVFMAFLILFYLLFISNIRACSSLLYTAQMLFEMILLQFNATEIHKANTYLGPLCFSLFIFFVVFIGMTMFVSIINDSFRTIRKKDKITYNEDHEMFAFMWNKFQRWTGMTKPDEWELQEERDKRMRSEYYHPIEILPKKVDQLLEALSRMKIIERNEVLQEETIITSKLTSRHRSKSLKSDFKI